jgi:hypothetical protein
LGYIAEGLTRRSLDSEASHQEIGVAVAVVTAHSTYARQSIEERQHVGRPAEVMHGDPIEG